MKAIVLAGGPAKQIRYVLGRDGSRSLLRFLGRSLLDLILDSVLSVYESAYVVSDDPLVARVCRSREGCEFVEQRGRGIEAAICSGLAAAGRGDESLVTIVYGDVYSSKGFIESHGQRVISTYEPLLSVTRPLVLRGTYLRVDVDTVEGRITRVGEGPFIYAGLATLPARELRERLCNGGMSLASFIGGLASRGRLYAITWLGEWVDMDTPWDYLVATRLALSRLKGVYVAESASIGHGVVLEGNVYVDSDARVDHYAVVKGPAYIGRGVLVGVHSFVRGGTAIYDDSVVGAYTEVKRSLIYLESFVGSYSYIADSVVGHGARVQPYTITLNVPYRSVSGEILIMSTQPLESLKIGSVIAAGAATGPKEVIPAASLYLGDEGG